MLGGRHGVQNSLCWKDTLSEVATCQQIDCVICEKHTFSELVIVSTSDFVRNIHFRRSPWCRPWFCEQHKFSEVAMVSTCHRVRNIHFRRSPWCQRCMVLETCIFGGRHGVVIWLCEKHTFSEVARVSKTEVVQNIHFRRSPWGSKLIMLQTYNFRILLVMCWWCVGVTLTSNLFRAVS